MRCPQTGTLRAFLDDELPRTGRAQMILHLQECGGCRQRLRDLEERREVARQRLAAADGPSPDVGQALAHTRERIALEGPRNVWTGRWQVLSTQRIGWRRVLMAGAALVFVVGFWSFAPTRALAKEFLSIFRVRQVVAVRVDPDAIDQEQLRDLAEMLDLDTGPVPVVDDPPVNVADINVARAQAGFEVKMPRYLPGDAQVTYSVKGYTEIRMPFTRRALEMLLRAAGMDPASLPSDLGDGEVVGSFPAAVEIKKGDIQVIQMLEPQIEYPEGIEATLFGEAALRLLGLPPDEANRIANTIDWGTTLLLPIPTNIAQFTQVSVAGGEGISLRPIAQDWADEEHQGSYPTLVWQRDQTMYAVSGPTSMENLLQIAESMF